MKSYSTHVTLLCSTWECVVAAGRDSRDGMMRDTKNTRPVHRLHRTSYRPSHAQCLHPQTCLLLPIYTAGDHPQCMGEQNALEAKSTICIIYVDIVRHRPTHWWTHHHQSYTSNYSQMLSKQDR